MRPLRPLVLATALGLTVGGCADAEPKSSVEKVKAAFAELEANPDTIYHQPFIDTDPATGQTRTRKIALVPSKDGTGYQIVDAEGEIYADYYDFLRDNSLPEG